MARTYSMKQRAERRDEVRRRIVDAAVVLKQTRSSGEISMAEVAEQAGVGRVTVYRHFRDLEALKQASSRRFFAQNPPPDPSRWAAIACPHARLREGLAEAHAYHRRTERMAAKIGTDAAEAEVRDPYRRLWRAGGGVLAAPFGLTGDAAVRLRAAVNFGLSFDVWRGLVRDEGLSDDQALDLVLRLCTAAAAPTPLSA
jgi:AcrR family transcriptional regulator